MQIKKFSNDDIEIIQKIRLLEKKNRQQWTLVKKYKNLDSEDEYNEKDSICLIAKQSKEIDSLLRNKSLSL